MRCFVGLLSGLITCVTFTASAAAEDGEPPREPPVWGTVVAAGTDELTVQPATPERRTSRRRKARAEAPADREVPQPPPAPRTFAVGEGWTEVAFAEVGREMPMDDGTTLRTFNDPVPATLADLKAGLPVQVTVRDGVATQVLIAWGVRGTLVRTAADSITFRPDGEGGNEGEGGDDGDADEEKTVTVDPEKTVVRLQTVVAQGPSGRGGFFRQYEYKAGRLSDLRAGDSVIVCIRDGAAAKVTVLPPPADRAPGE